MYIFQIFILINVFRKQYVDGLLQAASIYYDVYSQDTHRHLSCPGVVMPSCRRQSQRQTADRHDRDQTGPRRWMSCEN